MAPRLSVPYRYQGMAFSSFGRPDVVDGGIRGLRGLMPREWSTPFAGTGVQGFAADKRPAAAAKLKDPFGPHVGNTSGDLGPSRISETLAYADPRAQPTNVRGTWRLRSSMTGRHVNYVPASQRHAAQGHAILNANKDTRANIQRRMVPDERRRPRIRRLRRGR